MNKKRYGMASAMGVITALTLAACTGGGGSGPVDDGASGPTTVPTASASDTTITVWAVTGDYSAETLSAVNEQFTEMTGAKVDLQMQVWDGLDTKITTALSTDTPPDVIDQGNTRIAGIAASGGLLDLTPYKEDLQQGQTWLEGLEKPAVVHGKLYGVPGFAGDRAVIYNKQMWADAGITEAPKTYSELTSALDKIKDGNKASDFSAFYLPGQYWADGLQWVWDAGGDIATEDGGEWKSGLSSPAAQQGLEDFKSFQNTYSTEASQKVYIRSPEQQQLFADNKTAAILDVASAIGKIKEMNPELTDDDLGTFPFPGKSGKNQPVMLGGSDWAVPVKSENKDLALLWIKIAASPDIQNTYVFGNDGWIPNSIESLKDLEANNQLPPLTEAYFTAALNSAAVPGAAGWPTIESDNSLQEFFGSVASGDKTPAEAAEDFGAHIESVLNGN